MVKKIMQSSPLILLTLISLASLIIFPTAYSQTDEESLMEKGLNALNNSQPEKAMSYFDKILEIDPENVQALMNKGSILGTLGSHSEAIYYYDKILEIEPNNTSILNNKGTAFSNLEKYSEALSYFDKVLQIDPANKLAMSLKSYVLTNFFLDSPRNEIFQRMVIYTQIIIRNSNDNLVLYLESERALLPSLVGINDTIFKYMDTGWHDADFRNIATFSVSSENVTRNGQDLEWATIHHSGTYFGPDTVVSNSVLLSPTPQETGTFLLMSYHDGYPLTYGDQFDISWNVLTPIS